MFFISAEKQGSFFEGWTLRHFAFDTRRRYLYYSEHERASQEDVLAVRWKKKMKVTKVIATATVHEFHLDDPHLKETDFFTLDIHGRTRALEKDEPPLEPLLCPSTGLSESYLTAEELDESEICDPFRLRELYESLRDEFAALRRSEQLHRVSSTSSLNSTLSESVRTIQSPRTAAARERHAQVVLRCQSEEDFRRFWYVLQTVLGYDKLDVRPYRGLPPYDPRNGIPFAHIPMHLWHTFLGLDKTVFYIFMRGDLVGRDNNGDAEIALPGSYLCITHDMVVIMRDTGCIPRWVRLQDVNTFEYNTVAKRPFFALLTDAPSPDILFIPKPSVFGALAIANFSGVKRVMRVKSTLEAACFSSIDIRRAINIVDVNAYPSVRNYFVERNKTRRFNFTPQHGFDNSLSCMLPKVQLAKVWQSVLQEQRSRSQDDIAAIPLEGHGGAGAALSQGQLASVQRRMDAERTRSHDEIVALPLDRILNCGAANRGVSLETPTVRPDSFAASHASEYQVPGTHYISRDLTVSQGFDFGPESHVTQLVNTSLVAIGEKPLAPVKKDAQCPAQCGAAPAQQRHAN